MRAKYARQIRAGVEAAMRGERRTDGKGTSLECRAFNRTVNRASYKRLDAIIARTREMQADSEERAERYGKAQAVLQEMADRMRTHREAHEARVQEILDLEYQLNYPHPTEDSVATPETFEHIVWCLYCRHQFAWLLEGQH